MVTFNDFYNKPHEDKNDINAWTYGLFSYINRQSGKLIPPPSQQKGHGLLFTNHAARIDFAHANGMIEVLWQTKLFEHHTTPPPPSLQSTQSHTHFGCSFQINKRLANSSFKLKDAPSKVVINHILCKKQRYGP